MDPKDIEVRVGGGGGGARRGEMGLDMLLYSCKLEWMSVWCTSIQSKGSGTLAVHIRQDVLVEHIFARNKRDEVKQYLYGLACIDHSSSLPVVLQCKASISAGQAPPILLYHLPNLLILIFRVQQLQRNHRKSFSTVPCSVAYRTGVGQRGFSCTHSV